MFRSDLGSSGIHILKRAVAAGHRDVPDSDNELSLKIRLNIRLYPRTNSYNTNKFGKNHYIELEH